jgi:hypothetical protein
VLPLLKHTLDLCCSLRSAVHNLSRAQGNGVFTPPDPLPPSLLASLTALAEDKSDQGRLIKCSHVAHSITTLASRVQSISTFYYCIVIAFTALHAEYHHCRGSPIFWPPSSRVNEQTNNYNAKSGDEGFLSHLYSGNPPG